jgi:hypothetical protein
VISNIIRSSACRLRQWTGCVHRAFFTRSVVRIVAIFFTNEIWNAQQTLTVSSAKSMDTFRGLCKIHLLLGTIPNLRSINRLAWNGRSLKILFFFDKSFLRMAVAGSSITQMLHVRRIRREGMGRKCCPMAFLEEYSEHFPEFFYSVPSSWKSLNLNASRMTRLLQMWNDIWNQQRSTKLWKPIIYNCKTNSRCSLYLLYRRTAIYSS